MPTPSDVTADANSAASSGEWTARSTAPKRSVFGNYRGNASVSAEPRAASAAPNRASSPTAHDPESLVASVDLALARAFVHRFLAKAFEDPTPEGWRWLNDPATQRSLSSACELALTDAPAMAYQADGFEAFLGAYLAVFGHAARGSCPLNEIEYGDLKADPLFQPHRLADLAAFYRAFGLELAEDSGERQDHLCLELEFMCVLVAKEAYALHHHLEAEQLAQCREAQKTFLREHLGRWTPAFTRRLAAATQEPALQALAVFTRAFIEAECTRFGVKPGNGELALRPVDEAASRMCESCGIQNLPPGALTAT